MKELETITRKSQHVGWKSSTIVHDCNGYDWQITTCKRNRGGISCSAQAGTSKPSSGGFSSFTFMVFQDPSVVLANSIKRATEKSVRDLHNIGLLKFDELIDSGQLPSKTNPEYKIEIGQIIFTNGYGETEYHHQKKAIYEIDDRPSGTIYRFVNLETLALGQVSHIKDIREKFGIGTYYREGETITQEELTDIIIEAKALEAKENRKKAAEQILNNAQIAAKLEEGKKLVNIPLGAKTIILAHLKEDTSDIMTDYFSHTNSKTIYLAFSTHARDLFSEFRKASLNAPEVKHLANAPKSCEHREKYSMGSGYYLSERRHSGWAIRKGHLDLQNEKECEKLYIAAAEGRFFCPKDPSKEILKDKSNFRIKETTHTKKGHQVFVVSLVTKVSKDQFIDLLSIARTFDGYYSSYCKDGAIPGFQFRASKNAADFIFQVSKVK